MSEKLSAEEMLAVVGPQAAGWRQSGEVCRRLDRLIELLERGFSVVEEGGEFARGHTVFTIASMDPKDWPAAYRRVHPVTATEPESRCPICGGDLPCSSEACLDQGSGPL